MSKVLEIADALRNMDACELTEAGPDERGTLALEITRALMILQDFQGVGIKYAVFAGRCRRDPRPGEDPSKVYKMDTGEREFHAFVGKRDVQMLDHPMWVDSE